MPYGWRNSGPIFYELMAKVLGMPGYAFSVIDHPVSSASDQELEARALQTMAAIDEQILL